MTTRGTSNSVLSHILPELKMTFQSRKGVRTIRFSPLARLAMSAGLFALTIGSVGLFAAISFERLTATSVGEVSPPILTAYERRLEELVEERNSNAAAADAAQTQYLAALDQLSQMQSQALADEARMTELSADIAILQEKLTSALTEKDLATQQLADLMSSEEMMMTPEAASSEDLAVTLGSVSSALKGLVENREEQIQTTAQLEDQIAFLSEAQAIAQQRQDRLLNQLEDAVQLSLVPLDGMLSSSGMDVDSLLSTLQRNYSGAGGRQANVLFAPDGTELSEFETRVNTLMTNLDHVAMLTLAIDKMPLAMPVRTSVRYTSGFGYRSDPVNSSRRMHSGLDMAGPRGTPIYASGDGEVIFAGTQSGYGRVIKIRHDFGFETVYAHLNKIRVSVGAIVNSGDRIGDMGNSGRSTG